MRLCGRQKRCIYMAQRHFAGQSNATALSGSHSVVGADFGTFYGFVTFFLFCFLFVCKMLSCNFSFRKKNEQKENGLFFISFLFLFFLITANGKCGFKNVKKKKRKTQIKQRLR